MQLISLTSNQKSFKPVFFKNETGVNIILATQVNQDKSDKEKTSNGVGKSLLVALIHFCLGSSAKKSFAEKLPRWEFTLKFRIKDELYSSTRSTTKQNYYIFNGESIHENKFKETIAELLFDFPKGIGYLSFRTTIPFFIRPQKASYNEENNPTIFKKDFHKQLVNAFLLGLDLKLAHEKQQLKEEGDRIKELADGLKKDPYIKSFFLGKRDINLEKSELLEKINMLKVNLSKFDVAQDYYAIKEKANSLKRNVDIIQNNIDLINIKIDNIDSSLQISPDLKKESIIKIYEESKVILNHEIKQRLSDLESFYLHITKNRVKRLLEQKKELETQKETLVKSGEEKSIEINQCLRYLDTHQALDVFLSLSQKLADTQAKLNSILKYEELLNSYNLQISKIKKDKLEANDKTFCYLDTAKSITESNNTMFRSFAKRFYPNFASGITVEPNVGDNQIRYNIATKIEADKSDGIGNVKIFCYDMTLLLQEHNHHCNFIFHDSRLLEGIDPRQKSELFKIADETFRCNDKQYIITANLNQLEEMKQYFDSELEYKKIISDNIIYELGDKSPEEKLLGIQVELDYD